MSKPSYIFEISISDGTKATRYAWQSAREHAHSMMAEKARKMAGSGPFKLTVTNQKFERDEAGHFALGRLEYTIKTNEGSSYYTVRINREKRVSKSNAERDLLIECRDVLSAAGGKSKLIEKIEKYLDGCK